MGILQGLEVARGLEQRIAGSGDLFVVRGLPLPSGALLSVEAALESLQLLGQPVGEGLRLRLTLSAGGRGGCSSRIGHFEGLTQSLGVRGVGVASLGYLLQSGGEGACVLRMGSRRVSKLNSATLRLGQIFLLLCCEGGFGGGEAGAEVNDVSLHTSQHPLRLEKLRAASLGALYTVCELFNSLLQLGLDCLHTLLLRR